MITAVYCVLPGRCSVADKSSMVKNEINSIYYMLLTYQKMRSFLIIFCFALTSFCVKQIIVASAGKQNVQLSLRKCVYMRT